MKVLGIESASLVASVAMVCDGQMTAEYTLNLKKTHSQTLLPMIDQMMQLLGEDVSTVDAIAVSGGPGSFTGLRIGAATAKGLAYALNKPIVSVPTTAALAANFFGSSDYVCPIMDARRNQVYNAIYSFENDELVTFTDQRPIDVKKLVCELDEKYNDRRIIFLGDGVPRYRCQIDEILKADHIYAAPHLLKQHAGAVALLGEMYYNKGETCDAYSFTPVYLRMSQAERERKEKLASGAL